MPRFKNNKRARVADDDEAEEAGGSSADEVVTKPAKKPNKKSKVAAAGEAATDPEGNLYWAVRSYRLLPPPPGPFWAMLPACLAPCCFGAVFFFFARAC